MAQEALSTISTTYPFFSRRYGLAVAAVLVAAIIRVVLNPWMPEGTPFITFFFAVMFAAWTGGLGPGIFASALSALLADLLFIGTPYQFVFDSHYAVSMTQFGLETVAISIMADKSNRTEAALREQEAELEDRVNERTRALVDSQERLRSLATELNLTEQRERRRLAEALHDQLQQMLVLAKLKVGQVQHSDQTFPAYASLIQQVDGLLAEALDCTRTLVTELSPPVLYEKGLIASLQWLAEYMKKHDLTVTMKVSAGEKFQLPEDQVILLFQSVRELLINSSKHAGTGQACVSLEHRPDELRIAVSDEGKGFDPAGVNPAVTANGAPNSKNLTFGFFSIRERMKALGGSLELESIPGKGTTVWLTLPLKQGAMPSQGAHSQFSALSPQSRPQADILTPAKTAEPDPRTKIT